MKKSFVSYLRVLTTRQGESGLGLEAQRTGVEQYVRSIKDEATIVREYVEVESGKRADRPVLQEAIREWGQNWNDLTDQELEDLEFRLEVVSLAAVGGINEAARLLGQLWPARRITAETVRLWLQGYEQATAMTLAALGLVDEGRN